MATVQVLKLTHTVEKGVRGIADKVVGVDDRVANINIRVAGVDHRVADVDNRVAGVDDRVTTVDNKVAVVIEGAQINFRLSSNRLLIPCWPDGKQARAVMQRAANDVDEMKRWSSPDCIYFRCEGLNYFSGNQLRQDLRRWLSPSDPSTNHNIACSTHHEGTAAWFFQGRIFKEWKTTHSLLWVHGKRMFSTVPPNDTI